MAKVKKMTKKEAQYVISFFTYNNTKAMSNNNEPETLPYTKKILKKIYKEQVNTYKRLRDKVKKSMLDDMIGGMADDLPKYVEDFTEDTHQEWVNKHGDDYRHEVIEILEESKEANSNNFIKLLERREVHVVTKADEYIPLVKGSEEYYKTIADAQEKMSTGTDTDGEALNILEALNITPEIDPFAVRVKKEYLVGKLFPLNTMGEVFGKTGNMKTFWLQHLAFCVAHGIDFHGQPVKQGRVIYVITEAYDEAISRFQALEDLYDTKIDKDMLKVLDEASIDLSSKSKMVELGGRLKGYGKSQLMVIDILEKAASKFNMVSGDGWNEMERNMMQHIKPYVSVITWVTHPPKNSPTVVGGSGNRNNHSDFVYRIDRKGEELKNTLNCVKNKGGAKFEPIDFLYQINEEFDTLVPSESTELSAKDAEVLKLIESGKKENDAIDEVYELGDKLAKSTLYNKRAKVKKRLKDAS